MKHQKWLATINADWGRNITVRLNAPQKVEKSKAKAQAEKIKDQYGDTSLTSKVVKVEPIT